jgi:hypothetical protein
LAIGLQVGSLLHGESDQDQVRVFAGDLVERGRAIVRLADHVDDADRFQVLAQDFARDRFVVNGTRRKNADKTASG